MQSIWTYIRNPAVHPAPKISKSNGASASSPVGVPVEGAGTGRASSWRTTIILRLWCVCVCVCSHTPAAHQFWPVRSPGKGFPRGRRALKTGPRSRGACGSSSHSAIGIKTPRYEKKISLDPTRHTDMEIIS
jgi:hypothetical protein